MYKIVYYIFYAISLLPYKCLYVLSYFFYLIIYYIIGYRRKLVKMNISSAFPDKDKKEIIRIEKGFYHWLCDYFVETLKLLSVSDEELLEHLEFRNIEEIERCYDKGQTCAAILGHYCNWELLSATGLAFKRHKEAICGLIYHPLRNDIFNKLFIDIRRSKGGVCVPKKDILRYLITYRREKRMWLFGYISDQSPKWSNIHLWLPFLNHDTPVFTGGEKIMRKMNDAVFYVDMERPKRGKYICTFRLITDKPTELPENEITIRFFSMLEETICRDPRFYLWSHDRWKRTHEEFDKRYYIEKGRVIKKENQD